MKSVARPLWVHEAGKTLTDDVRLHFSFHFPDMPCVGSQSVPVPASARSVKAGFANHILNRAFAQRILETRVQTVFISGLFGCTLDLIRVASLLKVRVCLELLESLPWRELDQRTAEACHAAFDYVDVLVGADNLLECPHDYSALHADDRDQALVSLLKICNAEAAAPQQLDYALYEFCLRDHPLLLDMQRPYVQHFVGCHNVLDLACGAGIFLELLDEQRVPASGVERDPKVSEYARGMGFNVETSDALTFLEQHEATFDGIYCSHFVEHLPVDALQKLIGLLAYALAECGVLVLVFPDPESIRSQLLGFWRDPEHVRFYHPDLIELMAMSHGLVTEWHSQRAHPHNVVPFPEQPPALTGLHAETMHSENVGIRITPEGRFERLLSKLGLASRRRLLETDHALNALRSELAALRRTTTIQSQSIDVLAERTHTLWNVNQTWAWDDNAVLRLRKVSKT